MILWIWFFSTWFLFSIFNYLCYHLPSSGESHIFQTTKYEVMLGEEMWLK